MKKQLTLKITIILFATMLNTRTILAIDGNTETNTPKTIEVPVSFDNSEINDPDKPNLSDWSVSIPTTIEFTDNEKTLPVNLELVALNGTSLSDYSNTFQVDVTVRSTNGFTLDYSEEKLPYIVKYGSVVLSTGTGLDSTKVASLKSTNPIQDGQAELDEDIKPRIAKSHIDKLTYTITKVAD